MENLLIGIHHSWPSPTMTETASFSILQFRKSDLFSWGVHIATFTHRSPQAFNHSQSTSWRQNLVISPRRIPSSTRMDKFRETQPRRLCRQPMSTSRCASLLSVLYHFSCAGRSVVDHAKSRTFLFIDIPVGAPKSWVSQICCRTAFAAAAATFSCYCRCFIFGVCF